MGVFTEKFIGKGEKVLQYKGRITTWSAACEKDHTNPYLFYITEDYVIDGKTYKKSFARYINDAKGVTKIKGINNNCEFRIEDNKVFIYAIKNIAVGNEILVGYGKEYWDCIKDQIKNGEFK